MKTMDERLKSDLKAEFAPDNALNRSILNQAKETYEMKKNHWKPRTAVAAVAAVLVFGSLSAYAAYRYLSPSQVAEHVTQNRTLADAFESTSAVCVNETQTTAGYDVTFLGTVSGKELQGAFADAQEKKTYAVVAIAKADGTPMPDMTDPEYRTYCVSPLIHGKTFFEINNAVLNAGVSAFVQEGIQYELLECDDLEIFADRGVSLGIVENFGEESSAFFYDEATGIYSRNMDYEGINALFELPLDPEKADEASAEAYFQAAGEEQTEDEETMSLTGNAQADTWIELAREARNSEKAWKSFLEQSVELKDYTQTVTPDEEGYIHYLTMDGESENIYYVGDYPQNVGAELFDSAESDGTFEGTSLSTIMLNEDGSFTLRYYAPKG